MDPGSVYIVKIELLSYLRFSGSKQLEHKIFLSLYYCITCFSIINIFLKLLINNSSHLTFFVKSTRQFICILILTLNKYNIKLYIYVIFLKIVNINFCYKKNNLQKTIEYFSKHLNVNIIQSFFLQHVSMNLESSCV